MTSLEDARHLRQFWWLVFQDPTSTEEEKFEARKEYKRYYGLVEMLKKSPTAQLCQVAQEIGNDT